MIVAVTGSREFTDWKLVFDSLRQAHSDGMVMLKAGDAKTGADVFAWMWQYAQVEFQVPIEIYEADWRKYGKAAGPIRNHEMINSGVDRLLAFPTDSSIGTVECCNYAKDRVSSIVFPEVDRIVSGNTKLDAMDHARGSMVLSSRPAYFQLPDWWYKWGKDMICQRS